MADNDMKKCPYCAELIKKEAIKCRYCGSTIGKMPGSQAAEQRGNYWRRVNAGKRVAGVCTGLANEFNTPKIILPLRVFFVLTTIFYGFGFILYILLWLLMPSPVDGPGVRTVREVKNADGESPSADGMYRKKFRPLDIVLGLLILLVGAALVLTPLSGGFITGHPGYFDFHFPFMMPVTEVFGVMSALWPVLIMLGLFLLFFGALKVLRLAIGCGMIAVGAVFLVLFVPFLPRVLVFPGLIIVGLILVFIGILKLIFGSTDVVREETVVTGNAGNGKIAEEDWDPYGERK